MHDETISVVASAYCLPITDLVEKLLAQAPRKVVAGNVAHSENGYALAIVLLLVVMLEAYIGRVNDLQIRKGTRGKPRPPRGPRQPAVSIPDYILLLRKSFGLQKSLTEVFVLRDVIAHGHVWTLTTKQKEYENPVLLSAQLGLLYGDGKYRAAINPKTNRTKITGLNLIPSAIGVREVAKVFDLVWKVLEFLVRHRLLERNVMSYGIRFKRQRLNFWELRHVVRKPLNTENSAVI